MRELPVRKLLVIEDDQGLQAQLKWAFDDVEVVLADRRESALAALRAHEPAVVTLDLGLPPDPDGVSEGFATLDEILKLAPATKIIVASGHSARQSALDAVARGAYDFYAKPIDIDALAMIVRRAFQLSAIEAENRALSAIMREDRRVLGRVLTGAPEMAEVARTLERVAPTGMNVMLLGAQGTGLELLARGLHDASERSAAPFVATDCAAIPEPLLAAELFGREEASGSIERAGGGTLFLQGIDTLPPPLQVKLLRLAQEGVIEREGGTTPVPVDARLVTATGADAESAVAQGRIREDLFYRLAEVAIRVPSLAERPGDPALLAKAFLSRFAAEMNPKVRGFASDALEAIDAHDWPGNVRELRNRVKRAVVMADGTMVSASDLDLAADIAQSDYAPLNLKAAREEADRTTVRHALARTDGNISRTARLLGISRPTLYDLIKQHGLQT